MPVLFDRATQLTLFATMTNDCPNLLAVILSEFKLIEHTGSFTKKGIRDAGSTADYEILFEILKFKKLEIRKF